MSDKYYRLITFVVNICPRPLRELFIAKARADTKHAYTSLEDYLLFRKPDIDELRRRVKISLDQFANIYPADGSVDIQTWDITLLAVLLTQLFSNQLKQNERDRLYEITDIRNNLQHIASTDIIDDQKFNTAWCGLEDAVLELSKSTGVPSLNNIEEDIKSAFTEGMPNLVEVIRTWKTWNNMLCMQLQLQNSVLTNEIKTLKEESRKSNKILTKASVKRKGRSGIAEKRMKIVDTKVERMKEKLAKALTEENDCVEAFKNDIALITQQLIENHRVIVTSHDNMLTYKCALAAVNQRNYQRTDQCLEINNPSDWKRISPEDVQFVLFREPFGRSTYDSQKVETMLEEFDSMLDAANDENDEVIDIIIVTNQRLLNEVARQNEHDMLSPASTVYIDTTSGNTPEETCATEDPVYRNLLENSRIHRQSYASKPVNKKVKAEAENMFIDYSAVAIVGSAGSGKTSLSFELLPKYDLSNGEENFLVLMDPGELKYVNFSLRPVIIIKPLAGMDFDKVEASKWYRQFGRLFSAVQEKKAAVIIMMETEVFRMWEAHMRTHPLLDHVVYMAGSRAKEMEKHKPDNVQNGLQTEKTSHYDIIPNSASRDVIRYVKSVRDYDIGSEEICSFIGCCVLPTGHILLADNYSEKLTKTDRNYRVLNTIDLPGRYTDVCYIDSNVAVVARVNLKLQFVDITEGLTLTKSVDTEHACNAVACHGNKLYVINVDTVHVYTTDGEYQNVLYTAEFDDDYSYFRYVAVSNDGRMIYISDYNNGLVTIDSSGNHLYTLADLPNKLMRGVCMDDQGYVYVLCYDREDCVIMQVSADGRQTLGTVLEFDGNYNWIQFDKMNSALLVAGNSKKLRVLTLR
ncbi:uncharacterized protein LOC123532397 [Mercenaria mercenaria]|uniref:uncharacterized protein LOC123532397 n=1 Tax=Mercenaria mercenaria TaxID=6596 RepID=UPI00234F1CAC|nr:uncharacterized protein LOC123532397 [Mercenaria mercenaria]XP_053374539.1 uncharacterized protein LOC123532397 [Mercenaria mercenaria]